MKNTRKAVSIAAVLAGSLGLLAAPAVNAQVSTFYPTSPSWTAAVNALGSQHWVEFFDDNVLDPHIASMTGASVQISVPSVFNLSALSPLVRAVVDGNNALTITFSQAMIGFGANFDLNGPGGPGSQVTLGLVDGSTTTFSLANWLQNTQSGEFSGIVSVLPFTSVVLSEGTGCCQETFEMDNMKFAAAVPEPETYAMLLAGLGLMGFIARRRSKNAAA